MPKDQFPKKIIFWGILSMLLTFTSFYLVFENDFGWLQSVSLWFQSFEFNASFYYIAQWLHAMLKGYENIGVVGPLMAIVSAVGIGGIWIFYLRKKDFQWPGAMVIAFMVYYLMSTTVHPWYIGPVMALSVISGYSSPVVWTYLIFLSYSHYSGGYFSENYLLIATEYGLLFLWVICELFGAKAPGYLFISNPSVKTDGKR